MKVLPGTIRYRYDEPLVDQNFEKSLDDLSYYKAIEKCYTNRIKANLGIDSVDDFAAYACSCFDGESTISDKGKHLCELVRIFDLSIDDAFVESANIVENLSGYLSGKFFENFKGDLKVLNKNIRAVRSGKVKGFDGLRSSHLR